MSERAKRGGDAMEDPKLDELENAICKALSDCADYLEKHGLLWTGNANDPGCGLIIDKIFALYDVGRDEFKITLGSSPLSLDGKEWRPPPTTVPYPDGIDFSDDYFS